MRKIFLWSEIIAYFTMMKKNHDSLYKELFSNPTLVYELLCSFVDEKFVHELDYSTLKKLNTHFITGNFRRREADIIYQIEYKKRPLYIYILLEFQSTVDKFMSLRLLEYVVQIYKDLIKMGTTEKLPPVFPLVLYTGEKKWSAPLQFKDLLTHTSVPAHYLPDFQYYKIAINEIPKDSLIKIKNAVASIFYVEQSNPEELIKNIKTFTSLIKSESPEIIELIADWFFESQDYEVSSTAITSINAFKEVTTMWATAVKEHKARMLKEVKDAKAEVKDAKAEVKDAKAEAKDARAEAKKAMLSSRQQILIQQLSIKFGLSDTMACKVCSVKNVKKLDNALKKIVVATSYDEIVSLLE